MRFKTTNLAGTLICVVDLCTGDGGFDVMVEMSQINLSANSRRTFMSTVFIPDVKFVNTTNCRWAPFPFELSGASLVVPSPTGTKLLIVRNNDAKDRTSKAKLEIWGQGQLLKEMHVPASVHGSVYTDEWYICLLLLFQVTTNYLMLCSHLERSSVSTRSFNRIISKRIVVQCQKRSASELNFQRTYQQVSRCVMEPR